MAWATHQCKESAPPGYSQRTLPKTPRVLSVNRPKQDPYLHPPFLKKGRREEDEAEEAGEREEEGGGGAG